MPQNCDWNKFIDWSKKSDVIAYRKEYAKLTKNLSAAILLSQIIYWNLPTANGEKNSKIPEKNNGGIYKTHSMWAEETGLTVKQVRRAIEILVEVKLITKTKGTWNHIPNITMVKLNKKMLLSMLNNLPK